MGIRPQLPSFSFSSVLDENCTRRYRDNVEIFMREVTFSERTFVSGGDNPGMGPYGDPWFIEPPHEPGLQPVVFYAGMGFIGRIASSAAAALEAIRDAIGK